MADFPTSLEDFLKGTPAPNPSFGVKPLEELTKKYSWLGASDQPQTQTPEAPAEPSTLDRIGQVAQTALGYVQKPKEWLDEYAYRPALEATGIGKFLGIQPGNEATQLSEMGVPIGAAGPIAPVLHYGGKLLGMGAQALPPALAKPAGFASGLAESGAEMSASMGTDPVMAAMELAGGPGAPAAAKAAGAALGAAFVPGMALGGIQAGKQAIQEYQQHGITPELGKLAGSSASDLFFAGMGARHFLPHRTPVPVGEEVPVEPPVETPAPTPPPPPLSPWERAAQMPAAGTGIPEAPQIMPDMYGRVRAPYEPTPGSVTPPIPEAPSPIDNGPLTPSPVAGTGGMAVSPPAISTYAFQQPVSQVPLAPTRIPSPAAESLSPIEQAARRTQTPEAQPQIELAAGPRPVLPPEKPFEPIKVGDLTVKRSPMGTYEIHDPYGNVVKAGYNDPLQAQGAASVLQQQPRRVPEVEAEAKAKPEYRLDEYPSSDQPLDYEEPKVVGNYAVVAAGDRYHVYDPEYNQVSPREGFPDVDTATQFAREQQGAVKPETTIPEGRDRGEWTDIPISEGPERRTPERRAEEEPLANKYERLNQETGIAPKPEPFVLKSGEEVKDGEYVQWEGTAYQKKGDGFEIAGDYKNGKFTPLEPPPGAAQWKFFNGKEDLDVLQQHGSKIANLIPPASDYASTHQAIQEAHPNPHSELPGWANPVNPRYGIILTDGHGNVVLRKVKGEYDGSVWSHAKGAPEPGEHPLQAALREVSEELGIPSDQIKVTGTLPVGFQREGSANKSYYYTGEVSPEAIKAAKPGPETELIEAFRPDNAQGMLEFGSNPSASNRDKAVLAEFQKHLYNQGKATHVSPVVPVSAPPKWKEIADKGVANNGSVNLYGESKQALIDSLPRVDPKVKTGAPDPNVLVRLDGFHAKGSNPGDFYLDSQNGHVWYIKGYEGTHAPERLHNEMLANKMYEALGLDTPEVHPYDLNGEKRIASRFLPGLEKVDDTNKSMAWDGFGADAWLANWDIIGLDKDNSFYDPANKRWVRLDSGGALEYRAEGEPKTPKQFGDKVIEVESMRHHVDGILDNPTSFYVNGDMPDVELVKSLKKVAVLSDSKIREMVKETIPNPVAADTLAQKLIARRDDIRVRMEAYRAKLKTQGIDPDAKPIPVANAKATGIKDPAAVPQEWHNWQFQMGHNPPKWGEIVVHPLALEKVEYPKAAAHDDPLGQWMREKTAGADPRQLSPLEFRKLRDQYVKEKYENPTGYVAKSTHEDYNPFSETARNAVRPKSEGGLGYTLTQLNAVIKKGENLPGLFSKEGMREAALLAVHQKLQKGAWDLIKKSDQKWWRKSKIVDAQGNPLLVSHVGPWFTGFEPTKSNAGNPDNNNLFGYHFQGNQYSNAFGSEHKSNGIYALSIQNPYIISEHEYNSFKMPGGGENSYTKGLSILKKLTEQGYDGIWVAPNTGTGGEWGLGGQIIPFHPSQVKAVFPPKLSAEGKLGGVIGLTHLKSPPPLGSKVTSSSKGIATFMEGAKLAVNKYLSHASDYADLSPYELNKKNAINPEKLHKLDIEDPNAWHDLQKGAADEAPVDLKAAVVEAAKNAPFLSKLPWEETEKGIAFSTPDGGKLYIDANGNIAPSAKGLEKWGPEAKAQYEAGLARLPGSYQSIGKDGVINLAETGSLGHEGFHWFLDKFATSKEREAYIKELTPEQEATGKHWEEIAADRYRDYQKARQAAELRGEEFEPKSLLHRIFGRVYEFVRDLYDAYNPSLKAGLRKFYEGEVATRTPGETPSFPRLAMDSYGRRLQNKIAAASRTSPERRAEIAKTEGFQKAFDSIGAAHNISESKATALKVEAWRDPATAQRIRDVWGVEDPQMLSGERLNKNYADNDTSQFTLETDKIPDVQGLRKTGSLFARDIAEDLNRTYNWPVGEDKKFTPEMREMVKELIPENVKKYHKPILDQVHNELKSIWFGEKLLAGIKEDYKNYPLKEGLNFITHQDGPGMVDIVQVHKGEIVGGADITDGVLGGIAGGPKITPGAPSPKPVFEAVDSLGTVRSNVLLASGRRARRALVGIHYAKEAPTPEQARLIRQIIPDAKLNPTEKAILDLKYGMDTIEAYKNEGHSYTKIDVAKKLGIPWQQVDKAELSALTKVGKVLQGRPDILRQLGRSGDVKFDFKPVTKVGPDGFAPPREEEYRKHETGAPDTTLLEKGRIKVQDQEYRQLQIQEHLKKTKGADISLAKGNDAYTMASHIGGIAGARIRKIDSQIKPLIDMMRESGITWDGFKADFGHLLHNAIRGALSLPTKPRDMKNYDPTRDLGAMVEMAAAKGRNDAIATDKLAGGKLRGEGPWSGVATDVAQTHLKTLDTKAPERSLAMQKAGEHLYDMIGDSQLAGLKSGRLDVDTIVNWRNRWDGNWEARINQMRERGVIDQGRANAFIQHARDTWGAGVDKLVREGVIDKEEATKLKAVALNGREYVPLRHEVEDISSHTGTGSGFSLTPVESPAALGRRSRADNPAERVLHLVQAAAVRDAKNMASNALHALVTEYPDPKLWSVDKVNLNQYKNASGTVVQGKSVDENAIITRVKGELKRITLEDPELLKVWKKAESSGVLDSVVKGLSASTRFYSQMVTGLSPEFLLRNTGRDIPEGILNIGADYGKDVAIQAAKNLKNILKTWKVIRDPNAKGEWADLVREADEAGMPTGRYGIRDPIRDAKHHEYLLALEQEGMLPATLRKAHSFFQALEDANHTMENGVRYAAYKAVRDFHLGKGESRDVAIRKAVQMAKEATVNFDKRGEWGPVANGLWAFFNANVQGTARTIKTLKGPKGRMIAGALMGMGVAMDQINSVAQQDEDKNGLGSWDQMPDFLKQRSAVLMGIPGIHQFEKPIMLPMPHGFSTVVNMGRLISATTRGVISPGKAGANFMSSVGNAFNPLDSADIMQTVTPTMLDPFVQWETNKDWAGRPIHPSLLPGQHKPDSELHFSTVSPWAKGITSWLNSVSGGDQVTPGKVDINPELIDHLTSYFGGGVGTFLTKAGKAVGEIGTPEGVQVRDIPFLRSFVYSPHPGQQAGIYHINSDDLDQYWDRYQSYMKSDDPADKAKAKQIPVEILQAKRQVDAIKNQIAGIRRAGKAVPDADQKILDLEARANRIAFAVKRKLNIPVAETVQ